MGINGTDHRCGTCRFWQCWGTTAAGWGDCKAPVPVAVRQSQIVPVGPYDGRACMCWRTEGLEVPDSPELPMLAQALSGTG